MKKILLALLASTSLVYGQASSTTTWKVNSLLSGYNVFVPTNGFTAGLPNGFTYFTNAVQGFWGVGFGVTNVLFTTLQGQIVYSWNTNIVGTSFTNSLGSNIFNVGDAFKLVGLTPDVNADINANASLVIRLNYTNDIPIAVTNVNGQYFASNWVYQPQQFPNWMPPANTNVYPNMAAATSTNTLTVRLYAVSMPNIVGTSLANTFPTLATVLGETQPSYTITAILTGTSPVTVVSNLPTVFTQKARFVYATVDMATNATFNGGQGAVINQMAIVQPQP